MKSMLILAIAAFLAWNSCNGQTKEKDSDNSLKSNIPKTDIKVNKQYDEHGNLKKYDSTYSYSYSTFGNDIIMNDSLIGNFNNSFFSSENPFFNNPFFTDSLSDNDFKRGFFLTPFFDSDRMNKLFWDLDSINSSPFNDSVIQFRKIY